jgi:hypothetical protein
VAEPRGKFLRLSYRACEEMRGMRSRRAIVLCAMFLACGDRPGTGSASDGGSSTGGASTTAATTGATTTHATTGDTGTATGTASGTTTGEPMSSSSTGVDGSGSTGGPVSTDTSTSTRGATGGSTDDTSGTGTTDGTTGDGTGSTTSETTAGPIDCPGADIALIQASFVTCPDALHAGQSAPAAGVTCTDVCCALGFSGCQHRAAQADYNACMPDDPQQSGTCEQVFQEAWSSQCRCIP